MLSSVEPRQYLCIDQCSFYATAECVARCLDPLEADLEYSENTIWLTVSVQPKNLGVKNRWQVTDIPSHIKHITVPPWVQHCIDTAAEIHRALALRITADVNAAVGTICTRGIGVNLHLAKIALGIIAKHTQNSIGILSEGSYRE